MYKAKVAVCSDIRTKHSTQGEDHVEFLNVKPWWYVNKPLGFKRLKKVLGLSSSEMLRCVGLYFVRFVSGQYMTPSSRVKW
jgi:hypothetical protein